MSQNPLSRRSLIKYGLGAMGGLAASRSVAQVCGGSTAEQPLGPFFPRPESPVDPIREDQNPATPIFLANDNDLTYVQGRTGQAEGQRVNVIGKVLDEACRPVAGATLVIWQASASGRYNHKGDAANTDFTHPLTGEVIQRKHDPSFQYWGRGVSDQDGNYNFKTIVPGFYPADLSVDWYRPPHIHFLVSAVGYPQLVTQMYFDGNTLIDRNWTRELNSRDLILQDQRMSEEERRELIVHFVEAAPTGELTGTFNITLKK